MSVVEDLPFALHGASTVGEAALAAIREGELCVLSDNLADSESAVSYLFTRAYRIQPEVVNRMLLEANSRPFLVMAAARATSLGLGHIPATNSAMDCHMEMIEAREGVTTGVSSADQARTMQVAADPMYGRRDIVIPGHVVTVRVPDSGTMSKLGPYEAAFDLTNLAIGHGTVAMCAMLDGQGRHAGLQDVSTWAAARSVSVVTPSDALDARLAKDPFVSLVLERSLTLRGLDVRAVEFADAYANVRHIALMRSSHEAGAPARVHVLTQDPLVDVFDADRPHVDALVTALEGSDRSVACYVAPVVEAPPSDRGEAHRASLLATRRVGHVVAKMLGIMGIQAVEQGGEGGTW